jgi:hypothetical protein
MRLGYMLFLTIFCFSCSSNRKTTTVKNVLLSYESGSCYGRCEVFKLKINKNKTIEYEGIKNVEKIGKYWAQISVNDYNKFEKLISEVDLKIIDSVYTSNSTDLHLRVLNIHKNQQDKKILLFDNIPLELKKIEKEVYEIVKDYKLKFKINNERQ